MKKIIITLIILLSLTILAQGLNYNEDWIDKNTPEGSTTPPATVNQETLKIESSQGVLVDTKESKVSGTVTNYDNYQIIALEDIKEATIAGRTGYSNIPKGSIITVLKNEKGLTSISIQYPVSKISLPTTGRLDSSYAQGTTVFLPNGVIVYSSSSISLTSQGDTEIVLKNNDAFIKYETPNKKKYYIKRSPSSNEDTTFFITSSQTPPSSKQGSWGYLQIAADQSVNKIYTKGLIESTIPILTGYSAQTQELNFINTPSDKSVEFTYDPKSENKFLIYTSETNQDRSLGNIYIKGLYTTVKNSATGVSTQNTNQVENFETEYLISGGLLHYGIKEKSIALKNWRSGVKEYVLFDKEKLEIGKDEDAGKSQQQGNSDQVKAAITMFSTDQAIQQVRDLGFYMRSRNFDNTILELDKRIYMLEQKAEIRSKDKDQLNKLKRIRGGLINWDRAGRPNL